MSYWTPLYCLDKAGKVRVYFQTLEPIEGTEGYVITSSTGLVNGKHTESKEMVLKAKGKNTIYEQAKVKAEAAYTNKRNEGYKSIVDLAEYAVANEIELDVEAPIDVIFRKLKIRYNTDTRWYPLPMLADKYEKHKKKVAFPGYIQPKLNGVRCLAMWDKDNDNVILVSRGGKTYFIPHIEKELRPFFQTNPTVILDGEIYSHGKRLQTISGAARKEKDAPDWLEYHVYDLLDIDKTQGERLREADAAIFVLRGQWGAKHIYSVPHYSVSQHEEIKSWHDNFVNDGYEGAMYRNPSARYGVSFRVTELLKVKEFIDEEFEIIGCEADEAVGIPQSFVFVLQNDRNDETFKARPTGSLEEKQFWYDNIDAFIGAKATVRYQERTADDLPHQGHVRSDKTKCLTIEEVDPLK